MTECLSCQHAVKPFHSFGRMPIANGFLTPAQFDQEFFFELEVGYCEGCHLVQLTQLVDPAKLFHQEYAYFSSISVRMAEHFERYADWVKQHFIAADRPFVVEVGSNDGIMLRHFAQAQIPHVGVEPSANVGEVARRAGVNTLTAFFNEDAARAIRDQYGPADAVLGANVICHIPDLHSIVRGLDVLLKEKGVFIFEEPYLGDIVIRNSYDQIYDEHVFYFSLVAIRSLFARYDMELIDALPQEVHGGSMRYVIARAGQRRASPAVDRLLERERELGLDDLGTFVRLSRRIHESRDQLRQLLRELKENRRKRITAYGATSKSTTVTNFCGIGPEWIDFISDTTPIKQGKYSPGAHIPVVPYERFQENYPDYALLFAWNHAEEILAKEKAFLASGGKFIVYVPTVKVLEV